VTIEPGVLIIQLANYFLPLICKRKIVKDEVEKMRRKLFSYLFSGFFCLFGIPVGHCTAWVCLDANAPIDATSGNIAAPAQVIAETGTKFTRINFILGPWSAPDDTTHHGAQNMSWFETYDAIINALVSRGVRIYGLIGAEGVKSAAQLNTEQYITDYVRNFVLIVGHFRDRVRIYESFNEPNNWASGTTTPTVPAYWFARMLERIYSDVKVENGHTTDTTWQVTLVSGPLFSHDQDTVASYFTQVYSEGINNLGWKALKSATGTYPLDGIGYHIYVAQGTTDVNTIQQKMLGNINAIWNVVTTYEGSNTAKRLWVSEFGWSSDSLGSEAAQAQNLQTGFNVLLGNAHVALASWFCLTDFPGASYGIFRAGTFQETDKKPAWSAFNTIATNAPTPTPTPTHTKAFGLFLF